MPIRVAILGSGNMAFHLLQAFDKTPDIELTALIVRNREKGQQTLIKSAVPCDLITGQNLSQLKTDIIFLAVPDKAIGVIFDTYTFNSKHIIVHTSGAEPMASILADRAGVFYPLQTLTWGNALEMKNVPVLIEGSDESVEKLLLSTAQSVSNRVEILSSENRSIVHLAAVITSNFSNHFLEKSNQLLLSRALNLDLLFPLLQETINKAQSLGPRLGQTGPAVRRDSETIERHMGLIEEERLREIYRLISEDIAETHGNT